MRIRKINTDSRRNNLVFLYALLNAEKVFPCGQVSCVLLTFAGQLFDVVCVTSC